MRKKTKTKKRAMDKTLDLHLLMERKMFPEVTWRIFTSNSSMHL